MVSDSLTFDNLHSKCVTVDRCRFELDGDVPNNGGVN